MTSPHTFGDEIGAETEADMAPADVEWVRAADRAFFEYMCSERRTTSSRRRSGRYARRSAAARAAAERVQRRGEQLALW